MSKPIQHRLTAIVSADVVGYSKLMGADQTATLNALRQLRNDLLTPSVTEHGGEIVKSMGDGWIIAFVSLTDAVQCSIDIQESLSETPMLRLRMGVHIGDVVLEDDDLFGDGVNIATRLQAAAAPGDVLISDVVHHSLDGRLGRMFHRQSPLRLKNIARAMTAYSWRGLRPTATTDDVENETRPGPGRRINLGFRGLTLKSGDHEAELLRDNVSEAIRAALANQAGFALVVDAEKADMLVEGTLQARGPRYRATLRLVDRKTQNLIKTERFDGVIADLFDAEDDLALQICTSLRFAAFAYEASALETTDLPVDAQDSGAIRVHVGGLLSDLKHDEWLEARRLMEIVLKRDPDDASALAMAGMACTIEPHCGWHPASPADRDQAMVYLRKAVRLNPTSDFAHTCLVLALLELAEDHVGALFTAEQLMKIAPHYAQGQMAHSAVMIYGGRLEEGLNLASKAIEPLKSRQLFSYNAVYLMLGLLLARRNDEVLHWGQMVNQRIENVPRVLLLMASAAAHMDDLDLARGLANRLMERHSDFTLGGLRIWPLKQPEDWEYFLEGLRGAGLPE
ncbi:MAG: hypothetical protein HOL85_06205 [Rhodospirillaceae bacterium]|nr:hypothetical protein [Rhodospirillaceae bacterium]